MIHSAHDIVVSRSQRTASWGKSTILNTIDKAEIEAAKDGSAKAILIFGSASIIQHLAKLDLIDEYHLLIHPVLLGGGTPLFGGTDVRTRLKRVEAEPFESGIIKTVYRRS